MLLGSSLMPSSAQLVFSVFVPSVLFLVGPHLLVARWLRAVRLLLYPQNNFNTSDKSPVLNLLGLD